MAWLSKEKKQDIAAALKKAKLPFKYSLAGANSHGLVVTITEAPAIFLDDYVGTRGDIENTDVQLNTSHLHLYFAEGSKSLKAIEKMIATIKSAGEWFDKSDSMTDYFNTAFYIDVNIGRFDKPCVFTGKRRKAKAPVEASPTLAKALTILLEQGQGKSPIPAAEPVCPALVNNGEDSFEPEVENAEVIPFPNAAPVTPAARETMVNRMLDRMGTTAVGAMLSGEALRSLAEASLEAVFTNDSARKGE